MIESDVINYRVQVISALVQVESQVQRIGTRVLIRTVAFMFDSAIG